MLTVDRFENENVIDIGSIFPVYTANCELFSQKDAGILEPILNKAVLYSLCSEALHDIAVMYGGRSKCVLLPAYTCQSVIAPFLQEGWQCKFFRIDEALRIDTDNIVSLARQAHPAVCVVHPYYGMDLNDKEIQALQEIKSLGCVMVEDLTQCIFSSRRPPVFDYYVGSLRKWFPIPDGAFLLNSAGSPLPQAPIEEYTEFIQLQLDSMYLRGTYFKDHDLEIKQISRRVQALAVEVSDRPLQAHTMSAYARQALRCQDIDRSSEVRLDNYRYLHGLLSDCQVCRPVCRDLSEVTTAPLYLPVYAHNRAGLQSRLAEHQIYAPILWDAETPAVLSDPAVANIYHSILALPVDQRYNRKCMDRIHSTIIG